MHYNYNNYYINWLGSTWQALMMVALLLCIWRKKDCSGISLRSQILYALVFTTRFAVLQANFVPPEYILIELLFMIVTYATVLTTSQCLSKTYEKQHDTARIDIWIGMCFLLSLLFNDEFDYFAVLMAFSQHVEAIAMIPQFQLILKTQRIDKHIIFTIAGMGAYAFFQVWMLSHKNQWNICTSSVQLVAATTQFLPYCEFFRRIYPFLDLHDYGSRETITTKNSSEVAADIENKTPNTGHLASNVSSIVLTPFSLAGAYKEKQSFEI